MSQIHNSSVPNGGSKTPCTPATFFKYAKEIGSELVDLKFCDMLGSWQHCTFSIDEWSEKTFEKGVGFDGSSIRGWQDIHLSDMLAVPDASTTVLDPFFDRPTVSVIADIKDPTTKKAYSRDPRHVARKAAAYMRSTGIADTAYVGPEPEFFIFDQVRFEQNQHRGFYEIDSVEGAWNTARFEEPNLGYKPSYKGGYFPVSPTDTYHNLRGEMVLEMKKVGIRVEAHHHEVATAGQSEIDLAYGRLLKMGDNMMWYKYIIRNVARQASKTATFMPKPIFEDNGSGMHIHFSLWSENKPLFAGKGYAGLSDMGLHAIGGILKHAPAIIAFTNPTTNSFRRLTPGFEAPVNLVYSSANRSASIRIPTYDDSDAAKRIEFRCPDPSCNGYLAFSAILMAVLDGIAKKTNPGKPLDRNVYAMSPTDLAEIPSTPASLDEALDALEGDHAFLTTGGVFTDDLIQTWIQYKRDNEVTPLRLRPHPYEFFLYYDS